MTCGILLSHHAAISSRNINGSKFVANTAKMQPAAGSTTVAGTGKSAASQANRLFAASDVPGVPGNPVCCESPVRCGSVSVAATCYETHSSIARSAGYFHVC